MKSLRGASDEEAARVVKNALRHQMKNTRDTTPRKARGERSAKIATALDEHEWLRGAKCVLAFWPFGSEIDLRSWMEKEQTRGRQISLPRITEDGLEIHDFQPENLIPHPYGMLEPSEDAPRTPRDAVDVVIAPALAIDAEGRRIGYGGGYYDRLMPTLPNAKRLGVCFDFQLVAELPEFGHDERVEAILTDRRSLFCNPIERSS